jgi:hypothetical protein
VTQGRVQFDKRKEGESKDSPFTMPIETFESLFRKKLQDYAQRYDVESLDSPNDEANLHTMIRNQIIVDKMQTQMSELASADAVDNAADIKKINDAMRDLIDRNLALERALAIDRASRKKENQQSVADYIASLKANAGDYLETQFIRVFCPNCKILVARFAPVHEHTQFDIAVQCSQCKRQITANRKERDVFFDVKDSDWRRKYPVEIIHPKKRRGGADTSSVEDDLVLGDEEDGS